MGLSISHSISHVINHIISITDKYWVDVSLRHVGLDNIVVRGLDRFRFTFVVAEFPSSVQTFLGRIAYFLKQLGDGFYILCLFLSAFIGVKTLQILLQVLDDWKYYHHHYDLSGWFTIKLDWQVAAYLTGFLFYLYLFAGDRISKYWEKIVTHKCIEALSNRDVIPIEAAQVWENALKHDQICKAFPSFPATICATLEGSKFYDRSERLAEKTATTFARPQVFGESSFEYAIILCSLGSASWKLGKTSKARDKYTTALRSLVEQGRNFGEKGEALKSIILLKLTLIEFKLKKYSEALAFCLEGLNISRSLRDLRQEKIFLLDQIVILFQLERFEECEVSLNNYTRACTGFMDESSLLTWNWVANSLEFQGEQFRKISGKIRHILESR